jgi:hypothetical protein
MGFHLTDRQVQKYARIGIDLSLNVSFSRIMKASEWLELIRGWLRLQLLESDVLPSDDTTTWVLQELGKAAGSQSCIYLVAPHGKHVRRR